MALRMVKNLCIHAVRATFLTFPAARSRSSKALLCGLERVATRVPLSNPGRTGAPAPDRAPTAAGPPVALAGRHADQGRARLPRERPPLGACQQPRAGTPGPHALGTLPQSVLVPPPRAGPEPRLAG